MRSLTWKLTLAFVVVGVAGAVLVAILVGQRTRSEFDRFASSRDQNVLVTALGDYYTATGSWDNVRSMLNGTPTLDRYSRGVTLVDANRVVVLGNPVYPTGQVAPDKAIATGTAVTSNGQIVGYVIPFNNPDRTPEPGPPPPDVIFLQRVAWATAASAVIAA
ncbi:MAG: two-component sensor histidine kinase, partial [Anaerolineae bacterium]|nr:two-component sensor histidine kinase [Anaerolineae bacterium]